MFLVDTKRLAHMLDLSERRVRGLKSDGIIKEYKLGSGLFEPTDAVSSYIRFIRDKNGGDLEDYAMEKAKLIRAKRKIEEHKLQLKESSVHTSEDVEQVMSDMLLRFKARLSSIASKTAPILAEKNNQEEIFFIVKGYIDEALEELSDYKTAFQKEEPE